MRTRSAADLGSHPQVPVHSSVTATVTSGFLLSFQSPSQRGLAQFPSQAQPFRVGSLTINPPKSAWLQSRHANSSVARMS